MSTVPSQWSDTATAATSTQASTSVATASEPIHAPVSTNHDVWDAWPVRAEIFGEASVTGRRVADDPMGLTDDGRAWGVRVDTAVNGFDQYDRAKVDDWINIHAGSVTPELYEARIVAAWESRYPPLDDDAIGIARDDTVQISADVGTAAQPMAGPASGGGTAFTVECAPCQLDFLDVTERGEARYLADTHNDLHHGGRDEAAVVDIETYCDKADDADDWSDAL